MIHQPRDLDKQLFGSGVLPCKLDMVQSQETGDTVPILPLERSPKPQEASVEGESKLPFPPGPRGES